MTTLFGNELFEYLDHLESEIDDRISATSEGSLPHLMHSQMREIVTAERDFLKYINQNGTNAVLSISPNGLPSVDSLNPDLEKMCELANDEITFSEIAQRKKKGIGGKNREEGCLYVPVSKDEWDSELTNRNGTELQSKVGFKVAETDDGKFELGVREDIHLQGYDQCSQDFPILTREGKMRYHVVWNKLIEDPEESFYVPNTELVLQGRAIKPPKKHYRKNARELAKLLGNKKVMTKKEVLDEINSTEIARALGVGSAEEVLSRLVDNGLGYLTGGVRDWLLLRDNQMDCQEHFYIRLEVVENGSENTRYRSRRGKRIGSLHAYSKGQLLL